MADEIPLLPCPIHCTGLIYPKKTRGAGAAPRNTGKRRTARQEPPIASQVPSGTCIQLELFERALISP